MLCFATEAQFSRNPRHWLLRPAEAHTPRFRRCNSLFLTFLNIDTLVFGYNCRASAFLPSVLVLVGAGHPDISVDFHSLTSLLNACYVIINQNLKQRQFAHVSGLNISCVKNVSRGFTFCTSVFRGHIVEGERAVCLAQVQPVNTINAAIGTSCWLWYSITSMMSDFWT